jgi:hypothetical protein
MHILNHEICTHDIMAIGKCYVTYNYNMGFRLTLFHFYSRDDSYLEIIVPCILTSFFVCANFHFSNSMGELSTCETKK